MDMDTTKINAFKIIKYSILLLYGYFLHLNDLLTFENRLKMHLILVPVFKLFNYYNGNNKRPFLQVLYSVVTDNILAIIIFKFVYTQLTGKYFTLFFPILGFFIIFQELIEFYLFPEGNYLVKVRNGIMDFTPLPINVMIYYYVSTLLDFKYMSSQYTFGWFIVWMAFSDFFFGIAHVLMHKIEYLWKNSHSIHHEYKLENVNSFANFYSHFFDSIVMSGSFIIPIMCFQIISGINLPYFLIIEGNISAGNAHNKYVSNHITCPFFFEYDLLDQTLSNYFGSKQVSEWHHYHHVKTSKHYTLYGLLNEEIIINIAETIISLVGLKVDFKKDEEKDD